MILLQAQSPESAGFLVILQLGLRILGIFVCRSRAKELNRDAGGWGILGFLFPIVAMIWVYCLKPKVVWDDNIDKK